MFLTCHKKENQLTYHSLEENPDAEVLYFTERIFIISFICSSFNDVLPATYVMQCRKEGGFVIDESRRMWKEAVVASLTKLSDNLLRQKENDENPQSEQPASGQNLHQEPRNIKQ
jgi:hypothetical protein